MTRGALGWMCMQEEVRPACSSVSWGRIHRDKVMLSVDLILQLRAQIRMETGLGQSGFSYPVPTLVSALLR